MKTGMIIFFLLQALNFHLCSDEELDTALTAEDRKDPVFLAMLAALEEDEDTMEAADRGLYDFTQFKCGMARWGKCNKKYLQMMFSCYKYKMCEENARCYKTCLAKKPIGYCKPCLCKAVARLGPKMIGSKTTKELLQILGCMDNLA